jgi:hypothetical protein
MNGMWDTETLIRIRIKLLLGYWIELVTKKFWEELIAYFP